MSPPLKPPSPTAPRSTGTSPGPNSTASPPPCAQPYNEAYV
jgi:hypothetical protein